MLSYPVRKELVGKRFLVIEEASINRRGRNLNLENLNWKAGYIRACSVKEICDKELQVLVEYDGASWEYRQWIKVHENTKAFLAENTIAWAPRTYRIASGSRTVVSWPVLTFVPIVDYLGLSNEVKHPVEFFGDKQLAFVKENEVSLFQDGDERIEKVFHLNPRVEADFKAWQRLQKAQAFLMNGAVTLTGLRVTVYRLQLRQWYTGCITAHNLSTRELHVMDDNVLQTHPENPALVQIDLNADDEELQGILHGKPLMKVLPVRKHRQSQIFLQANGKDVKPQEGVANWHMLRELTVSPPQTSWGHPAAVSVCHVVNGGGNRKNTFVPTAVKEWSEDKKPTPSLPARQKCGRRPRRGSAPTKDEPKPETSDPFSDEKLQHRHPEVQVCNPVPDLVALTQPEPFRRHSHCARAVSPQMKPAMLPLTKPKMSPQKNATMTPRTKPKVSPQTKPSPRAHEAPPVNRSPSPSRAQCTPPPNVSVNKNQKSPPGIVSSVIKKTGEVEPQITHDSVPVFKKSGDKTMPPNVTGSPSEIPTSRTPPLIHSVERHLESSQKSKPRKSPAPLKSNSNNVEVGSRQNGYQNKETLEKPITQEVSAPKRDLFATQVLATSSMACTPPNAATTAGVSTDQGHVYRVQGSSPPVPDRAPLCIHPKTISSIQLQHMILQKNMAEYQIELIREAMTSLRETTNEEQFFFIADFYHNLLEESRRTIALYSDVTVKTLELQQMEHLHHQSDMELISLTRTSQSFPDEVKTRLKVAKEAGIRKREEVLSLVQHSDQSKKMAEGNLRAEGGHQEEEYSCKVKEKQQLLRTSPLQLQRLKQQQQQQQKLESQQLIQKQKIRQQQSLLQRQQQQQQQHQQQLQHKKELIKQMQYKQNAFNAAQVTIPEKANTKTSRTPEQQGTSKTKKRTPITPAPTNYQEQLLRQMQATSPPNLSPEQLLATLTSTPDFSDASWDVVDDLAVYSDSLNNGEATSSSAKDSTVRESPKSEVSKSLDGVKSTKTKNVESDSSLKVKPASNGTASSDPAVHRNLVLNSGPTEDNMGSGTSSGDKSGSRGKKRKPASGRAESDTGPTKVKRQRKSRSKKEKKPPESPGETPVSISNMVTADGCNSTSPNTSPGSKAKNAAPLKVFPTGSPMPVRDSVTMSPDDRASVSIKNSVVKSKSSPKVQSAAGSRIQTAESDPHYFQPRSITKGIGFVPIQKAASESSGGVGSLTTPSAASGVNSPLDVLALISASLLSGGVVAAGKAEENRAVPDESAAIPKAPKKRRERPRKKKEKSAKVASGEDADGVLVGETTPVVVVMKFGDESKTMTEKFGVLVNNGDVVASTGGEAMITSGGTMVISGDTMMNSVGVTPSSSYNVVPKPGNAALLPGNITAYSDNATTSQDKATNSLIMTIVESASIIPLSFGEGCDARNNTNVQLPLKCGENIFQTSPKNEEEVAHLSRQTKEVAKVTVTSKKNKVVSKRAEKPSGLCSVSVDLQGIKKEAHGILGGSVDSDDKSIVFVSDRSIGNVVESDRAEANTGDVFNEYLFNRKRQHNQRLNNTSLKGGSTDPDLQVYVEHEGLDAAVKIDDQQAKLSDSTSGKELKVKKKTRTKENSEGQENLKVTAFESLVDRTNIDEAGIVVDVVPKIELEESIVAVVDGAVQLQYEESKGDKRPVEGKETAPKTKSRKRLKGVKKERKVKEKCPREEWNYFLQEGDCKTLPTMTRCRECRKEENEEDMLLTGCCRFDMFRRCREKLNKIEMAGFSCLDNAQNEDFQPWIPSDNVDKILTLETSKYILQNVGDEFCNLVKQEKEAQSWTIRKDRVAWKRAVRGTREMCDACATTIFNVHWVCPKCGFGVCLDCFKFKVQPSTEPGMAKQAKDFRWFSCTPKSSHRAQRLVLAQIIPKQTLFEVGEALHKARDFWGIEENCPCKGQIKELENEALEKIKSEKMAEEDTNMPTEAKPEVFDEISSVETESIKVKTETEQNEQIEVKTEPEQNEPIEVQTKPEQNEPIKVKTKPEPNAPMNGQTESEQNDPIKDKVEPEESDPVKVEREAEQIKPKENEVEESLKTSVVERCVEQVTEVVMDTSENVFINEVVVAYENKENEDHDESAITVGNGIGALSLLMDYDSPVSSPAKSPAVAMDTEDSSENTPAEEALLSRPSATVGESSCERLSPELDTTSTRVEPRVTDELPAPHSWICTRPMLRLHCAQHEGNLKAFQSRWEKGEPVLVSYVHENMTSVLWMPEGFAEEFGLEKADVVNCKTGGTLDKLEIGTFWRGFESVKDRPLDSKGEPTLLKLKDWPPEADFIEKMPKRFHDLNQALPLPEYTTRNGSRNLVARLPDFFVKPDLGPKMYNAYGNAAFPTAGTTNLHIDMSDAVNIMVYVGVPTDKEYGEQERRDSLVCIDTACDNVQQLRAREPNERLGALWHIFAAKDANKIRALFHKVAKEKNMKYPTNHDPIHDQCFYLDEPLLKRLRDEYDVVGWPIAQFLGDAVFIPAGAPHQVRNLHSCVKVAEDFVSPEHVGHCFKLTQEFRHLSDKHTNHEDKLQVKNIIYHAVKDAISVLLQEERELESRTASTGDEHV